MGDRGWPLKSGRRRLGIVRQPGVHRRPRGPEGTLPGRSSLMRNVTTPMRSKRLFELGRPTARNAQPLSGWRKTQQANAGGRKAAGTRGRMSDTSVGGFRRTGRIEAEAST